MRFILAASLIALAACQKDPPAPTAEEEAIAEAEANGQDTGPFVPAPVAAPRSYEAMSKTAMSFTPGKMTMTETPQIGPNSPSGMTFGFANGIEYKTTLMPGGSIMGPDAKPVEWANVFTDPSGDPIDPEDVMMYSVDSETVPAGTPNGGFCSKASFIATYVLVSSGAEDITLAAFDGDTWPPADKDKDKDKNFCGTFTYSRVH